MHQLTLRHPRHQGPRQVQRQPPRMQPLQQGLEEDCEIVLEWTTNSSTPLEEESSSESQHRRSWVRTHAAVIHQGRSSNPIYSITNHHV